MSRRRPELGEERRKERVEINLIADEEAGRLPGLRRGRGCALPFGILFLVAAAVISAHSGAGAF